MKNLPHFINTCKKSGFVKSIGNNLYSYGHLGTKLRQNIANQWWSSLTKDNLNVFPLNCNLVKDNETSIQNVIDNYEETLKFKEFLLPFSFGQQYIENDLQNNDISSDEQCQRFIFDSSIHEYLSHISCVPLIESDQFLYNIANARKTWWKSISRYPSTFRVEKDSLTSSRIVYDAPWGDETVETISNHGNNRIAEAEPNCEATSLKGKYARKLSHPCLVHCRMSLERACSALLLDSFRIRSDNNTTIFELPANLTPYHLSVLISAKKSYSLVREVADFLVNDLKKDGHLRVLDVDQSSFTNDLQYKRHSEMGIPWTVVLTEHTLDNGIVLLRNRDTTIKEKTSLVRTKQILHEYINTIT